MNLPPDLGREGAAGDGDAVHVRHRHLAVRVTDPDGRVQRGRVPDEPGVGMVIGGARLAGDRPAEVRGGPGAVLDVLLEDLRDDVGDAFGDDPLAGGLAPARGLVLLVPGQDDARDRHRPRVDAARGQGRVRGGHLERRDADRAQADRGDRGERRLDPELVRHRGDVRRADVDGQLRVDGVVGAERRVLDRDPARVAVVVGRHVPGLDLRARLVLERRRDVVAVRGVDALRDRRREHEGLERRPRLAPGLDGEVELVPLPAGDDRVHRPDRARARVDCDDRGSGVGPQVQRLLDRALGQALQARVDRRVHAEAPLANGVRPVSGDQLVDHVVEEVPLADRRVQVARMQVRAPVADDRPVLVLVDRAGVEHRLQDLVSAVDRRLGVEQRVVEGRRLR